MSRLLPRLTLISTISLAASQSTMASDRDLFENPSIPHGTTGLPTQSPQLSTPELWNLPEDVVNNGIPINQLSVIDESPTNITFRYVLNPEKNDMRSEKPPINEFANHAVRHEYAVRHLESQLEVINGVANIEPMPTPAQYLIISVPEDLTAIESSNAKPASVPVLEKQRPEPAAVIIPNLVAAPEPVPTPQVTAQRVKDGKPYSVTYTIYPDEVNKYVSDKNGNPISIEELKAQKKLNPNDNYGAKSKSDIEAYLGVNHVNSNTLTTVAHNPTHVATVVGKKVGKEVNRSFKRIKKIF